VRGKQRTCDGFVWCELLRVLVGFALLFLQFPALWFSLVKGLDARNWSRGVWLGAQRGYRVRLARRSIWARVVPPLA
jgi:hypothetical protein